MIAEKQVNKADESTAVHRGATGSSNGIRLSDHTPPNWSAPLLELICAAVVSTNFRQKLLQNPAGALTTGFNGQHFSVTSQEWQLITATRATSLAEFIAKLRQATDQR